MDDDEPVLLHEADLMLAILRTASAGPAGLNEAIGRLQAQRAAAGEEPAPDDPGELRARLIEAAEGLVGAGALEPVGEERWRITGPGLRLLKENPAGIDSSVLEDIPAFRAYIAARSGPPYPDDPHLPAFTAGSRAFAEGKRLDENPHASDSGDHLAWECGWSQARDAAKG